MWSSLNGVSIENNPCRSSVDDALLFYESVSREAITVPLNLSDIR